MGTAVLVTRPAHDALAWVQQLRAQGVAAEALPLLEIVHAPDDGAGLEQARRGWPQRHDALMFVSGNAVAGFFSTPSALRPNADCPVRAWSVGPGTTAALLRQGWPPQAIDAPAADAAQFESETLWTRVRGQLRPGLRVLIVRGADAQGRLAGRDWLRQRLLEAGAEAKQVLAYQRRPAVLDADQCQRAVQAASDGSLWLLSSSEAVAHLQAQLPGVDWGSARALATHERIAEAARACGFGQVRLTRPALDDVLASIKSVP